MPEGKGKSKAKDKDKDKDASRAIDFPFAPKAYEEPWRFGWFETMRWLEARNPAFPRFGKAARPGMEIVRITQSPSLSFAPAELGGIANDRNGRIRIEQTSFGLFGPNGPMPLHFTEFARECGEYNGDRALQAFLDIFHHRFALLFYRAWADVQATVSLDRRGEDGFYRYVGSLIGYGESFFDDRDSIPDHAKRYMAGHFARLTRNPEGLASILRNFFACPFRIQEWMPQRLRLDEKERTRLGFEDVAGRLGQGAICGSSVLDRQHRFRIHVGPLSLGEYVAFLPNTARFRQLRDWVRNYVGFEFSWDARFVLRRDEVPASRLGAPQTVLGWTSWLGGTRGSEDRGDLVLNGERPEMSPRAAGNRRG
ncbi:MAG: type VI secretion system baseplate subunit TssG [Azoarcus sp.]|jgi:type VI secretion system protein ImpH|nr:type VI secretion system baseplate subunit TssG [Azoarcus sp.]